MKRIKLSGFEIALLIMAIFSFGYTLIAEIRIDEGTIPEIVNGIASSISLIVGFTFAILTLAITSKIMGDPQLYVRRTEWTMILLGFAVVLLWTTYTQLMDAKYFVAFKIVMIAFAIVIIVFMDIVYFVLRQEREKDNCSSTEKS